MMGWTQEQQERAGENREGVEHMRAKAASAREATAHCTGMRSRQREPLRWFRRVGQYVVRGRK